MTPPTLQTLEAWWEDYFCLFYFYLLQVKEENFVALVRKEILKKQSYASGKCDLLVNYGPSIFKLQEN